MPKAQHVRAKTLSGRDTRYCDLCFYDWPCADAPEEAKGKELSKSGPKVWPCKCGWLNIWPVEPVCGMCGASGV